MEFSRISTAAQRKFWISVLKGSLQHSSIPSGSTDSESTSRSFRGFRYLRPQAQQQQFQNLSQASTQCGSIATVLSNSDQVGGFSGQRLNINYLSDSCDLDSGITGQEICASFPYSIGSGLPSHLQEPWAALIDSGAVTSIAPSSFGPHVPITPHSGQLVNVNGGEIKIKGQKKLTHVTHMVIMHITFLIVEDVLNRV